jgi:phage baseplate assembly protein W
MNIDVTKNFTSIRKDINKLSEDNSILESIENIIHLNVGELVGNSYLGSNTKKLLFKSNNPFILFDFVKQIEFSLYTYEKRITNLKVKVQYNTTDDTLDLKIEGLIIENKKTIKYSKRF